MMAPAYKKRRNLLFIIVSIIILIIGIAAFILSYGLSSGWDAVASWFSSKYAVLMYILVGCYLTVIILIFLYERIKKL